MIALQSAQHLQQGDGQLCLGCGAMQRHLHSPSCPEERCKEEAGPSVARPSQQGRLLKSSTVLVISRQVRTVLESWPERSFEI